MPTRRLEVGAPAVADFLAGLLALGGLARRFRLARELLEAAAPSAALRLGD